MVELIIYKNGLSASSSNIRVRINKWEQSEAFMGDNFVTFSVESPAPIEWEIGDWCSFRGEIYSLNYIPTCTQVARIGESGKAYSYESVKMNSSSDELTRCEMLDVVHTSGMHSDIEGTNYTGSSNFSLYCFPVDVTVQGTTKHFCAAHVLLDRIHANLLRLYGTTDGQPYDGTNAVWNFYIDDSKCETEEYVLTINNWTVAQALSELHNTFTLRNGTGKKLDYIIRGHNIIVGDVTDLIEDNPELKGLTGYLTDVEDNGQIYYYGYGRGFNDVESDGKGLFKITRTANSEQQIVTRLRAVGSTKNMTYRYYSDNYGLPQTMFINNLQLPQTFVPYTGQAEKKPAWQYDNKTEANIARRNDPDTENLRFVKGDTNDAYIDKNDDAESCPEGVREVSARWDGSDGDLPEIYPTIAEGTYKLLRGNGVRDMDGNTSGSNHFKNYGGNERIDEILALGTDVNIGDGIMSATDLGLNNDEHIQSVIGDKDHRIWVSDTVPHTEHLFVTNNSYNGECVMSFTETVLNLYMNIGSVVPSGANRYQMKVRASLILKKAPVGTQTETTIATFTFNTITLTAGSGRTDDRTREIPLPHFKNGALNTEYGSWDVETLDVDPMSIVHGYIQVDIDYYDPLPSGSGMPTLEWYAGLPEDYSGNLNAECQFAYSGTDTFMNKPFTLFIKDNGIDWNNLALTGDDGVKITMNSGYCGGGVFDVDHTKTQRRIFTRPGTSDVVNCWEITCSRAHDDSIGAYYPSNNKRIEPGDIYVVTGIQLPDAYIQMAEMKLLFAATDYLADNQETKFTYQPVLDELYLQRDLDKNNLAGTPEKSIFHRLHSGMIFPFKYNLDDSTGETTSIGTITIENVQIRMGEADVPRVEVKLNDEVTESTQQKLKITVDRIYGSLFGGGGGGGLNAPALLQFMRTEGTKLFLRKDVDDAADGNIEFKQDVSVDGDLTVNNTKTPDYIDGARGTGLYIDEYGNWHFETDYIHARTKLTAKELQVEDVSHIGGQQLLTAASMRCDFVVEKDDCWRCFFLRYDDRGRSVYNNWKIGDQAYVSTFNLETKDDYEAGNHFFWRLVTDTSNDTEDTTVYEIDGVEYDATDYHFIDLSKTDCAPESDAPLAGDDIVQLGNKSLDESERQNAIIIAGAGTGSPYIRQFTGITTYSLPDPDTQIKPGDNRFTGRVDISGGTLPDGTDIDKFYEALDTGDDNILRNSGFTGDYNSIHVDGTTVMEEETPVYSEQTEHWILDGDVTVNEMQESKSGYGVSVDGSISQEIAGLEAENIYTFSFKGRGDSLTLEIGDFSHVFDLTDNLEYYRIHVVMTEDAGDRVSLAGEFEICEPRLSKGNVASNDWARSTKDSDIAKAVAQASDYVLNAIKNGSTDILGGLILSQMLKVGNYRDGEMVQETGGMSGLYTSDNSPFLWGGGDLDKAFYTISKYKANPAYQATEAEVANMAKFVVTHGGRAILTDIVLRGYIYALGGVFNGKVYATDGVFNGTVNATDGVFTGTVNATGGVFSNVQSVNGKWIIDNDGNVTVDGAIKASKGLYFDKEIIDWDYYRISAGVGLAIINGNHDNIYMPENPGNGQQLIILNPTVAQKTLRLPPTMTDDRFMYYSGGELYHTTFTMSRTETVTFVYSEGVWLVTSRADFYYS
jgi:hypothetical protein